MTEVSMLSSMYGTDPEIYREMHTGILNNEYVLKTKEAACFIRHTARYVFSNN